jgi:hypothetical protein
MHISAADSLQTLAALRHLPPPLGDDARIDMTEASAWINRDFTKARAAAKLAIEKATVQGSPAISVEPTAFFANKNPLSAHRQKRSISAEMLLKRRLPPKILTAKP